MKKLAWVLVAVVTSALVVVAMPITAHAAEVASSANNSSPTDKIRCSWQANNAPASGSRTVRIRCYWDDSRSGYVSLAGSDLTNVTNTSPNWRLIPLPTGFSACTGNQVAVGPQLSAASLSGSLIPVGGVEISLTGCTGTATAAPGGTLRLSYTGSDAVDSANCNRSGNCLFTTGTGWSAYPPDHFPGGATPSDSRCTMILLNDFNGTSGVPVLPGSSYTAEISDPPFADLDGVSLSFRFAPGDFWRSDPLVLELGADWPIRFTNTTADPLVPSGGLELRCLDNDADDDATYFIRLGEAPSLDQSLPRPCFSFVPHWPVVPADGGETIRFRFQVADEWVIGSGGVTSISVRLRVPGDVAEVIVLEDEDITTVTGVPRDFPLLRGEYVYADVTFTAAVETIDQVTVVCSDSTGDRVFFGGTMGHLLGVKVVADDSPSVGRCLSEAAGGSGWNPIAWAVKALNPGDLVGDMVSAGACVLGVLFIPQESLIDDEFVDLWESSSLQDATGLMTSVATAVGDLSDPYPSSCEGTPIDLPLGGSHEVEVSMLDACSGPAATARDMAYNLMQFFVITGWCIGMHRVLLGAVDAASPRTFDRKPNI